MSVNKGTQIRFGEGVQVADRRRWQSAMTSPIGDVGSERVNLLDYASPLIKMFYNLFSHGVRVLPFGDDVEDL